MVNVLPPLNYLGQNQKSSGFGEDLFKGIGSGLQQLAQQKTSEIQKQKELNALRKIGLSSEESEILNYIKDINPQQYSEYLGRALENIGSKAQKQFIQQAEPSSEQNINTTMPSDNLFSKGISEKEKSDRYKSTKEYRESILNARKLARSDLKDLNRLEELSQKGDLDTPGYVEFLKESGFDIPALMKPDSQEFLKIQQSFLKNAKQYFGGRVSNYEVEQFLKTIPSLSQSPEGRKRVLSNLKYVARGAEEYYKAYEDVLKENKGIPPYDVQEQVERKIEKRLDKLSDMFKKDLEKPVPKGQNRIITALMAAAPNVVKGSASLAKDAVTGAAKGAGTAAGALLTAGLL